MTYRAPLLIAALAAAMPLAPLHAAATTDLRIQTADQEATRDYRQSRQQQRQGAAAQDQILVSGDVRDFKTVRLRGEQDEHLLVRVGDNGRTRVVNLGPVPQDLDLRAGDRIVVQGRRGTIDQRDVVFAERLKVEGDQRQAGAQGGVGQRQRLQGTVQSLRSVRLQGQDRPHTLATLRVDGRTKTINLGPRADRFRDQIEQGTQITVIGRQGAIDQRPVLMAERVRVDGEGFRIQRRDQAYQRGEARTMRRDGGMRDGMQQQRAQVRGRVGGFRQVQLEGERQPHVLMRLVTDDQRIRIIDLGPKQQLQDFDIDRDDTLVVIGKIGTIDGTRVLMADSLLIDREPRGTQQDVGMQRGGRGMEQEQFGMRRSPNE